MRKMKRLQKDIHQMQSENLDSNIFYVLFNHQTGFYKIGITSDIYRRWKELTNSSGCNISVLFYLKLTNDINYSVKYWEKLWHEKYKSFRFGKSEWFSIPEQYVKYMIHWSDGFVYDEIYFNHQYKNYLLPNYDSQPTAEYFKWFDEVEKSITKKLHIAFNLELD